MKPVVVYSCVSVQPACSLKIFSSSSICRRFQIADFRYARKKLRLSRNFARNFVPKMRAMGVVLPAGEAHVDEAATALTDGHVIALPTDTLYGLACDACSSVAVQRIYEIKGRISNNPLAICVGDISDIERFAVVSHLPDGFLDSLLPGPVTLILERGNQSLLDKSLNPGIGTIGVRIPQCDFIRMVARKFGSAIALTSANKSGQPSTVSVKEFEGLWEQCAIVFDGGQLPMGRAGSTIVDLCIPKRYKILREGSMHRICFSENFEHRRFIILLGRVLQQ